MLSAMDVLEEVVLNSFSFSLCLCGSEKVLSIEIKGVLLQS